MNATPRIFFVAATAAYLALVASPLWGQVAPAASAGAGPETTVKLDPFSVSADSDVGFVAASSLAGGRIATALKDTPVAYSVVTKEFLEAFNITDASQATNFTPNATMAQGDGTGNTMGNSDAALVKVRGYAANTPTRNFFPYASSADSFNLDRIDMARGANAVLFGAGGLAGTVNSVTKQATLGREVRDVRVSVGSWNRYRLTADFNQPINDKLALRTNLLWASGDTWRDREWDDKEGVHLAGIYKLNSKFTIRGEFEYLKTERLQALANYKDQLVGWDGKFHSTGPNPALTPAQLAEYGVVRAPFSFVMRPEYGGVAMNFQDRFRTNAAAYNANPANTGRINGVPIRTIGFSLGGVNNGQLVADVWDTPKGDRFTPALSGSYFHVPSRYEGAIWSDSGHDRPTFMESGRDAAVYFTYTPTDMLSFELAGDVNAPLIFGNNVGRRGMQVLSVDIDKTLPNGEPNPMFLHPYSQYLNYNSKRDGYNSNVRFQGVYVKSTRFGKLQFGVMGGAQEVFEKRRQTQLLLNLHHLAVDARVFADGAELNEYALYNRQYLDDVNRPAPVNTVRPVTVYDPIRRQQYSTNTVWVHDTKFENNTDSHRRNKYAQAALNVDLLRNRLVLIGAFRRDYTFVSRDGVVFPGYNLPGWDGTTLLWRQHAPADYDNLTYIPKNAAGAAIGPLQPALARPRTVITQINGPAPQYANDRFQDDYNTRDVRAYANSSTFGAVINVNRWLGVYANRSSTFNVGSISYDAFLRLIPPTASKSDDVGIRLTLPNGRLAVSMGWFHAYQPGAALRIATSSNFITDYNAIANAPVVGDFSPGGQNIRGARVMSTNTASVVTNDTNGYELEVTANLTSNWRLILNGGITNAFQSRAFEDLLAFFPANDAITRQILADTGILINPANNQAYINPALDDPTMINQTRVQPVVNAWNDLQNNVIPSISGNLSAKQKVFGQTPVVGNIATDYRIRTGKFRGLRFGVSMNYRGKQYVGNRGADTLPDPSNPLAEIDDPKVDAFTMVEAPSWYRTSGTLSYTMRLNEGRRFAPKTIQFDLVIDNLTNRNVPMYQLTGTGTSNSTSAGAIQVPIGGDITKPGRTSIPGNVSYPTPRNLMLSAKLNF